MDDSKKWAQDEPQLQLQDEPQVVAEFRIVNHRDRAQLLADEYNSCPVCGSELEFTHVTDFAHNRVEEEAYCYACNISAKKDDHKLQ